MALILEVLDDTGAVRERRRIDTLPLSLGRAYDNDVILDDPYVDAHHARIAATETGEIRIEDLGSVNGVAQANQGRQPAFAIQSGVELRLGRTRIHFRDTNDPLPPALADGPPVEMAPWKRALTSPAAQLALTLLAAGVVGFDSFMGSYQKDSASEAVSAAIGVAVLAGAYAGVWGIAGRLVTRRFRFIAHLALTSSALMALYLVGMVSEWWSFVLPGSHIATWAASVVMFAGVSAMVATHLAWASALAPRRRWWTGVVTATVITGIVAVTQLADRKSFSDVPSYDGQIKAMPTSLLPKRSVAEFTAEVADLRLQVDRLAKEHP
ncbi:MAG TPA: FHA domain-containing protein [Gemmatimonadales bacterium]